MKGFASAIFTGIAVLLLALAASSVWTKTTHSQFTTFQAEQTLVAERFADAKKFFEATAMDLTLKAFKEGKNKDADGNKYGCGNPDMIGIINQNTKTFFGAAKTALNEDNDKEVVETIINENGVTASINEVTQPPVDFVAAFELTYNLDSDGLAVESDNVKKTESNVELTHYLYVESQNAVDPKEFKIQILDENKQIIAYISSKCNNNASP